MEVKLIVVQGKHAGQEIPIPGPKFFIGRAEDCSLRPHSDLVSRHHCVIMVEEGFVAIRDFNSKNGTLVNDERVNGEIELKSGDRLKVGQIEFEVSIGATLAGKKAPKVRSVQEAAARTVQSSHPQSDKKEIDVEDWFGDTGAGNMSDTTTVIPAKLAETVAEAAKSKTPPAKTVEEKPKEPEEEKPADQSNNQLKSHKAAVASTRDAATKGLQNLLRRF